MSDASLLFEEGRLERVGACPACDGEDLSDAGSVRDNLFGIPVPWRLSRCAGCGLVFVNPRPTQDDLGRAYEELFPSEGTEPTAAIPGSSPRRGRAPRMVMSGWHYATGVSNFEARFIPEGHGRRVLDIGCGTGGLGATLVRRGYRVSGIEINRTQWDAARSAGVTIVGRTLEELDSEEHRFDAVVLSHVIEHLPRPAEAMTRVRRLLEPGGRLYVSCPNHGGWQRKAYGEWWHNWHLPFHLSHFEPRSLRVLLERSGFTVRALRHESPASAAIVSWRTKREGTRASWDSAARGSPAWLRAAVGVSLRPLGVVLGGDHLVAIAE